MRTKKFKKWYIKAIVQKTISFLPHPERINFLFQKYVTKGVLLTDEHFEIKIQHARDHYDFIQKYSSNKMDLLIVELGTGWYPIIPMIFYLTNSGHVISIDIQDWLTRMNQHTTIQKLFEWKRTGRLQNYFKDIDEDKWQILLKILHQPSMYSKNDVNEIIGLKCLIQDARDLNLKDNSVDFICSNNTLEHIYEEDLQAIFKEFIRILKPDGVMSHFIDLSDHFAHFDPSITIYNFLKYSKRRWRLIDNKIQPQNRLRYPDYKSLYEKLGISITEEVIRSGTQEDLMKISVHEDYLIFTYEELAISQVYFVNQKSS